MTIGPSSTCELNIASLDGVYLLCMFCAFPKPLRKRSGLCLRVTSNDNLFAVICVQTTGNIQKLCHIRGAPKLINQETSSSKIVFNEKN